MQTRLTTQRNVAARLGLIARRRSQTRYCSDSLNFELFNDGYQHEIYWKILLLAKIFGKQSEKRQPQLVDTVYIYIHDIQVSWC